MFLLTTKFWVCSQAGVKYFGNVGAWREILWTVFHRHHSLETCRRPGQLAEQNPRDCSLNKTPLQRNVMSSMLTSNAPRVNAEPMAEHTENVRACWCYRWAQGRRAVPGQRTKTPERGRRGGFWLELMH